MNLLSWSMIESGFLYSSSVKRFVGGKFNGTVMHVSQDNGHWGVNIKLWNELGQKVQQKLANESLNAQQNLKEHFDHGKIVFELANEVIDHNLSKWTNKKFIKWLKEVFKHYLEINALGFLAVVSDIDHNYLSNKLASILEKHSTPQNPTQKYLATLISPDQPDLNWHEHLTLLKIVSKHKKLNQIIQTREFKAHAKKYKWLNYGYQGPLWSEQDFIKRVEKILSNKQKVSTQLEEHQNHFTNLKKEQKDIERKLKLSDHGLYMFRQARILMFTKAYRLNVRHAIQYALELAFAQLGKIHSVPVSVFRYSLPNEILDFLSGKKFDTVVILRRRNKVLKVVEKSETKFIPVNEIDKYLKNILEKDVQVKQNFVEGQSAFAGKARGKAKLVFGTPDLKKVVHGDILIAVTTTPDILPAMGRAIAFVTDSGGITSHAAIIAREMKKPCVIGTKFATRLFKDGDMVEVDANKGIVRKV